MNLRDKIAEVLYIKGNNQYVSDSTFIAGADAHPLADAILALPEFQRLQGKCECIDGKAFRELFTVNHKFCGYCGKGIA